MTDLQLSRKKNASWEEQMNRLPGPLLQTLDIGGGNSPLMFKIPGSVTMNLNKNRPHQTHRDGFLYDNPQSDIIGDASQHIPLPNESIGTVTMHHVIGPADDPNANSAAQSGVITPEQMTIAAKEIYRVLAKNGKLYIYSGHLANPLVIGLYVTPLKAAGFSDVDYATSKHDIDDEVNQTIIYEESIYEEIGGDQDGGRRESIGGLIIATK